jgi:hypothetical protein
MPGGLAKWLARLRAAEKKLKHDGFLRAEQCDGASAILLRYVE